VSTVRTLHRWLIGRDLQYKSHPDRGFVTAFAWRSSLIPEIGHGRHNVDSNQASAEHGLQRTLYNAFRSESCLRFLHTYEADNI
jgi:hypothetical protein